VFKARAKHDREVFLNNLCDELETDGRTISALPSKKSGNCLAKEKKLLALPSKNQTGLRVSPKKKHSSAGVSISYPH